MNPQTYSFVLATHILAVILWASGLTTVFWLLRFHDHAPPDVREKLTLMERAMALSTDITLTVAIGCGLAMALSPINQFVTSKTPWLHIKLTAVVLFMLPVHGILRARIKRYARGEVKPISPKLWSLFLVGLVIAVIAATTKFAG